MTCFTPIETQSECLNWTISLTMLIGADQSGRMLEVGVAAAEGIEFIVHAMPAREKFLR